MIKFSGRRNLRYIIQLTFWSCLRVLIVSLLNIYYHFDKSRIFTFLMFFGEFSSGLIFYKYQSKYLRKKEDKFLIGKTSIKGASAKNKKVENKSSKSKIYILLFFASFLDVVEFNISTYYLKKIKNISTSLNSRLYSFLVICNALTYVYILKYKIFRHQKFSLVIIINIFIITIASEYLFQNINELFTYVEFTEAIILILIEYYFRSMIDIIDKYLLEIESYDPFLIIIFEGIFGSFLSLLSFIAENPFIDIKAIYDSNSISSFCLFLLLLFLYYLFGALRNAFRIMTNKLYSPMELTLSDYFLNPIFIVLGYFLDDFQTKGKKSLIYFLINLITSILASFSTLIYNEFLIIFCCGFEYNTYSQITKRSKDEKIEIGEFNLLSDELDDSDDEDEEKQGIYMIYI